MNAPTPPGMFNGFWDSLRSFFSGLGGEKDKSANTYYYLKTLTDADLQAAFRCDWIARKVVTIPAKDGTREWRRWQAENDQIELIEKLEKVLKLKTKTRGAWTRARLYGGGALIMGLADQRLEDELIVEEVKKDQLKFIHVVSKNEISGEEIERDMESPYYGMPKFWKRQANAATGASEIRIHPSRVIPFIGNECMTEWEKNQGVWGDSVLLAVDDAVRAAGIASQGIAALIEEMKYDVIRIPDLASITSNEESAKKLATRFTYANTHKSILNALLMDKDEEWETKQINFASLPEVLQQYLVVASGASDIPVTRMLGQSPAGLNATGESDIRNYYDHVAAEQKEQDEAMERLNEVMIRSATGERDEDIYHEWNPLWQQSELEKADVNLKNAQAFKIHVDSGLIPDAPMAEAFTNQLIEQGTYPGLEEAIADLDFETIFGDPNDPHETDPVTGERMPSKQIPDPKDRPQLALPPGAVPKPGQKLLPKPRARGTTDEAASALIRQWHDMRRAG